MYFNHACVMTLALHSLHPTFLVSTCPARLQPYHLRHLAVQPTLLHMVMPLLHSMEVSIIDTLCTSCRGETYHAQQAYNNLTMMVDIDQEMTWSNRSDTHKPEYAGHATVTNNVTCRI